MSMLTPSFAAGWTLETDPILTGVMSGMVQVFFAWKIWVLTKYVIYPSNSQVPFLIQLHGCRNYFYVGAILICALASLAGAIATSIAGIPIMNSADWEEIRNKLYKLSLVWLAPAAFGDLIITVVITVSLQRAKGSIRRTNCVLNKIIRREFLVQLG